MKRHSGKHGRYCLLVIYCKNNSKTHKNAKQLENPQQCKTTRKPTTMQNNSKTHNNAKQLENPQ